MYIIIMNNNKTLTTSKRVDLYEGDNLADKLRFLFPQTYQDVSLADCVVTLNYIDVTGQEQSEILVKDNELYKDRLSYRYPIDSKFTRFYGDIVFDISFSMVDEDENTEDFLFYTARHTITINARPNSIAPDEVIPEDSAGKILKEVYELEERVKEVEENGVSEGIQNAVQYVKQELTNEQKAQVRKNIDAIGINEIPKPVQSDWNQNDEAVADYVKNRTHYVESVAETVEIVNEVVKFNEEQDFYVVSNPQRLVPNENYIVTIDGAEYKATSFYTSDDLYRVFITNITIIDDNVIPPENEEPFVIMQSFVIDNGMISGVLTGLLYEKSEQAPIHLVISITNEEVVKKLDNKFLDLDWLPEYTKIKEIYNKDVELTYDIQKYECLAGYCSYRDNEVNFNELLEVGKQYLVKIGEKTFVSDCKQYIENDFYVYNYLGSISLYMGDEDTGEPYCIFSNNGLTILYGSVDQNVNVKIYEATVNKMPEKYIPDNIPKPSVASIGQTLVVKSIDENGRPVEWECVDVKSQEQIQADYAQSDSTKPDYIKNRPFYEYEDYTDVIFDQDINMSTGDVASYNFTPELPVEPGELCMVYLDDNSFLVTADSTFYLDAEYSNSIGMLFGFGHMDIAIVYPAKTNFHLKICKKATAIKTLDEKFIPDLSKSVKSALINSQTEWSEDDKEKAKETLGIANTLNSDWDQNDETAPNYIKNRTHYSYEGQVTDEIIYENNIKFSTERGYAWTSLNIYGTGKIPLLPDTYYFVQINKTIVYLKSGEKVQLRGQDLEDVGQYVWITAGSEYGASSGHINIENHSSAIGKYVGQYDNPEVYLKISTAKTENIVVPLEDKFVPDTILRFEIEDTLEWADVEMTVIDDGDGNVTMVTSGIDITDDCNGNITITSEHMTVTDDGSGNVTISV